MLKKNQPVKFARPVSTMKSVMQAIEHGHHTRQEIVEETGLVLGKVRAALYNLCFIGVIHRTVDEANRTLYVIPGASVGPVAKCLKGIPSIFHAR